jgi:hypothetical protein
MIFTPGQESSVLRFVFKALQYFLGRELAVRPTILCFVFFLIVPVIPFDQHKVSRFRHQFEPYRNPLASYIFYPCDKPVINVII